MRVTTGISGRFARSHKDLDRFWPLRSHVNQFTWEWEWTPYVLCQWMRSLGDDRTAVESQNSHFDRGGTDLRGGGGLDLVCLSDTGRKPDARCGMAMPPRRGHPDDLQSRQPCGAVERPRAHPHDGYPQGVT